MANKAIPTSVSRSSSLTMIGADMMQTIRRGESMICTDPKGELRSKKKF